MSVSYTHLDLTIADADINDTTNAQGIGAFINCVDSMTRIELDNCHPVSYTHLQRLRIVCLSAFQPKKGAKKEPYA